MAILRLNRKEQLRHRAASLRQHGFLVKFFPATDYTNCCHSSYYAQRVSYRVCNKKDSWWGGRHGATLPPDSAADTPTSICVIVLSQTKKSRVPRSSCNISSFRGPLLVVAGRLLADKRLKRCLDLRCGLLQSQLLLATNSTSTNSIECRWWTTR